jgi:malonyl-CoA O-methyltransferase
MINIRYYFNKIMRLVEKGNEFDLMANYQKAIKWIDNNSIDGAGICQSDKSRNPYPEVTGYYIPTLLNWGELERAIQFSRWLVSIQNSDGSWSDVYRKWPYTFDTGQILKGLLAILPRMPEVEQAIQRGCDWLLEQIMPDGRVVTPNKDLWQLPGNKMINESIHLYALEPLRKAAEYFNEPKYKTAVDRALAFYLAQPEIISFNTLSHLHAYVLEALVDLGHSDIAAKGMIKVEQLQKKDGSIPAYPNVKWICSTGMAQYAVIWYKIGKIKQAQKAFNYLCKLQHLSGGFYGSYGFGDNYFPKEEISWALKYYLDALYWHIRTSFDHEVALFPANINHDDVRLQTIMQYLGDISGLRVLDAGCGKGRFAKALLEKYPSADIWGLDISDEMLRKKVANITTRQGSLMNMPFPDNYFDHAYCVESLEHVITPKAAIRELFRVVKPGGHLLIIDKNVDCLGSLKIEAWERWFDKNEVEILFSKYCKSISSRFISAGKKSNLGPDNLFIAWNGIKL